MTFENYTAYIKIALDYINGEQVRGFIDELYNAYLKEKMIFIIGNGGSAASASHFAQDLAKGTRNIANETKRIRALSLTDNIAFISALGNDEGFESIFEQQLKTFSREGDLLIAISGSGNSPNILKAIDWANENNITSIGLTAFDGGELIKKCKFTLHVDLHDMCTAETLHTLLFHYIVLNLKSRVEKENNSYSKYLIAEQN